MAQIDDFFMYENRVEGITDADYQQVQPYVEAAQAFAQTTYQSIYIIDYYRKNFLYVSDNPLFLCGHTADEVRQMGYGFYLSHVPENEVPMLTELNRSGFRAFYDEPVENRRQCMMSYDFHITHGDRLLLVNHKITPLAMTRKAASGSPSAPSRSRPTRMPDTSSSSSSSTSEATKSITIQARSASTHWRPTAGRVARPSP